MKNLSITLSVITAGLLFIGCGSGSSSSVDGVTQEISTTSLIRGTVPGTLIEVFCEDGSYYSVNSTQNDTNEHPFEIEIPKELSCRLVMTTNENNESAKIVTPIGIITPDGNGTLFRATSDIIDLGYVDLAMNREDINDTNGDGVSDDILEINIDNQEMVYVYLENDPMDSDNDGLLNVYENDDNDTKSNYDDNDDDNDGIDDNEDNDQNNDGINDNDLDGDGISNDKDKDDDNDGINDDVDPDDDNDGINDDVDPDDDNDGIDDDNDPDHEQNYEEDAN